MIFIGRGLLWYALFKFSATIHLISCMISHLICWNVGGYSRKCYCGWKHNINVELAKPTFIECCFENNSAWVFIWLLNLLLASAALLSCWCITLLYWSSDQEVHGDWHKKLCCPSGSSEKSNSETSCPSIPVKDVHKPCKPSITHHIFGVRTVWVCCTVEPVVALLY